MDGTASESVHPPSQSTAPSSRRFSASRVADAIEKLLIFWSRLGKRELNVSRVDEQVTALRGICDIGSSVMLAVIPKPSIFSLCDLLRAALEALKVARMVGAIVDPNVGPGHLPIIDPRARAFWEYAESVPGDVVVVPLELRQTRESDDTLQNVMMEFGTGEFLVDPYVFGVALLCGQLGTWAGTVRCPASKVCLPGRFRKGIPLWSYRSPNEYAFWWRETQFSRSSEPYVVGFAPEKFLSKV